LFSDIYPLLGIQKVRVSDDGACHLAKLHRQHFTGVEVFFPINRCVCHYTFKGFLALSFAVLPGRITPVFSKQLAWVLGKRPIASRSARRMYSERSFIVTFLSG
jgi:hypothetical protein